MNSINIALLFLIILAAQAFFMFLSSKNRMKSNWYLYILAIPLVTVFPVIMYSHDKYAFNLYQYAVVICIIAAAIMDIVYAARYDKDYMNGDTASGFLYAYLIIVTAIAWYGNDPLNVKIIAALLLAGSIAVCTFVKKHSMKELLKAPVLAVFSIFCSWSFLAFAL